MLAGLYAIGAWLLGSMLARVLVGGGLMVAYYVVISTVTEQMIALVQTQIAALPAAPYQLLGLGGVWEGAGYIVSAVLARATLQAATLRLVKA